MTRLPVLKAQQIILVLEKIGFTIVRQRGSHVRMTHADGRVVTVPSHQGQDIGRGLLRKILRDADLSPDEFRSTLNGQ